MKHVITAAVVSTLALGLAACGGTSTSSASPSGAASGSDAPAKQMPTVQPCDYLDTAKIGAILGYAETKHADSGDCALTPTVRGGADFQFNYQWWFKGGLAASWKSMKSSIHGTASKISVPGADDARLVINVSKKAVQITGFVENDTLVQLVNAQSLPKDRTRLLAATKEILAELSAGAPSPTA